ncbi:Ig-like domain-containing protein [Gottfriedia acidiceleris]|uniref:Ig-like domain-containing protein n=1 Tax=Gottfriedia acidiceleris TaxID=371036 RepID=A0ABY4JKZ8_9BACI|nr:Ig-like domain-containing protein [Gottfriedia acidiceleris]UPM54141.1 Ig-like domain-containing protein [Gottfriedia acidiceleris]
MKSTMLKVGLLTMLSIGLVAGKASAATDWSTKCLPMGEIKQNVNPSNQQINCLLTNAALSKNIPPEVVKSIAMKESSWRQFDEKGQPVISSDNGLGIMQVTDPTVDPERLKNDIVYNIETGVSILDQKYGLSSLPKINGAGRDIIENWYFPVMAYNGTMPVNSPLKRNDDHLIIRNLETYQDKVFNIIEEQSLLGSTKLAQYPFAYDDFSYDPNLSKSITFNTLNYIMTSGLHESVYLLKKGDIVKVTTAGTKLRTQPNTSSSYTSQPLNKVFVIDGEFKYTEPNTSLNHFVWFPVKTTDGKISGYISSAYIAKKKDFVAPIVTGVKNNISYNKDVKITFDEGTALLNGTGFKNGQIVSKPGKYTLVVKDEESNTTTINFTIDKTKPSTPAMNTVSDQSTTITGTAEAGSTVKLSINGKFQKSTTAASNKSYKFTISKQKSGTTVSVNATDKAGNASATKSLKVLDKTPPALPVVNKVTSKSKTVTGSAEKYASVKIYRGSTLIGQSSVNSSSKFSVSIKVQKANTYLKVYVIDKSGNKSVRTIKVVK